MSRIGYTLAILASSVLASACTDDLTADTATPPPPGSTSGRRGRPRSTTTTSGISPVGAARPAHEGRPAAATRRTSTRARRSATRPSATC